MQDILVASAADSWHMCSQFFWSLYLLLLDVLFIFSVCYSRFPAVDVRQLDSRYHQYADIAFSVLHHCCVLYHCCLCITPLLSLCRITTDSVLHHLCLCVASLLSVLHH